MQVSASFLVGQFIGSLLISYVLFKLLMLAFGKAKNKPINMCIGAGIVLMLATIIGGFGLQDNSPNPLYLEAFINYSVPVLLVLFTELVRMSFRKRES